MAWTAGQIRQHVKAARALNVIKNYAFGFIRNNKLCSEGEVLDYVMQQFERHGLITNQKLIIAFGTSAAMPHYTPKGSGKRLCKNCLVKLDIWGRLKEKGSPYADITWMAKTGCPPKEQVQAFETVILARNCALRLLKKSVSRGVMPSGSELDCAARNVIKKAGFAKNFVHKLGHELGLTSPHGRRARLCQANKSRIARKVGYTIEPGIYVKNSYGVRSEIDFFVINNKVIVTGPMQKKLVAL